MQHLFSAFVIAIVAFTSTNLDNLIVLSAFLADPAMRFRSVVLGQFLGIGAIVFVSVVSGLLALAIPPTWIALLGIIPIFLGVRGLIRLWRKRANGGREATFTPDAPPQAHLHSQVIAVTLVTMAHGADNLGVYIPLFARTPAQIPLYVAVFAVMTAFSCLLGHTLIRNRLLSARIIRYGHAIVPFFLCGLGLQILWGARPLFVS